MRELDHLIGVKRAIPDAFGNWTPVSAYEGWRPVEPTTRSGWWLVGLAALVIFAIKLGG